ncbi:hypothetical protein TSUD_26140 [Trifolium subterraneum]|uniref:DUF4378 domain-containing protein n=1 Tax=Trifolium subterraneum TaxID=3900 RepID=A0A2Z6PAF9_TRISU|nr:hypothetical protein TSUD_26140 [Trifolium subterraneum]
MTRTASIDIVTDQNLEKHIHKHMGCMAGFFQIFDRNHILSGKRIYSTKRLPPPSPETLQKDGGSPVLSVPSPVKEIQQCEPKPNLPVLELKEGTRSSWKFSREAPRLSLDSRAVVDAKGALHPREIRTNTTVNLDNNGEKQRLSTSSVIVRLMGLDSLPTDSAAKLQRSASESRVSRDRFSESKIKSNNHTQRSNVGLSQMNNHNHNHNHTNSNVVNVNANNVNFVNSYGTNDNGLWNGRGSEGGKGSFPLKQSKGTIMVQKKSFYDSTDFFPEPKHNVSIYGEIEKRLKMRGINQPSQDLDTLKHILEALQLKGLLHSQKPNQSPIVLMKPLRSSSRFDRFNGRTGYDSPPPHSSVRSSPQARRNLSPRLSGENDRAQVNLRNLSPNRRNVPNVEIGRRFSNEGVDSRRVSPVHSPKISSRRNATAAPTMTGGSPRMRKVIDPKVKMLSVAEDEWSTVSDNSFTTSNSHTDTERYKSDEYKEGRNLLDRCDKLLNSIAEITASNELQQPSPVSVLDSSFYKDEWCSPSPITKRCIDYNFKDQAAESEDEMWSAGEGKSDEAEDCDFGYVSEILRASSYFHEDCDIFGLLEKQQFLKGKDTSKASTIQRRLIFDTLQEILNRNNRLPPWKAVVQGDETPKIWLEFQRIREREESESESSEDLFGVICGVLKKDMAEEMSGWGEWTVEMGDVVLDIERLVFKDLIGETIQHLASFLPQCNKLEALRRKLVF